MKILIIEDEAAIREEILDMLMFEGHEVYEAANGRDGIAMAIQQIPDLIISDITMPEMDGYGVLMELKDHPELKTVPFIFLTARADRSFVRHGMELGADDYVVKPFTRTELLAAINSRLSRHQAIAQGFRAEVDELKARITRMVTQELKTPLAGVTFIQQIMQRQFGELNEAEVTDLLQKMRSSTDRLQHVVQQIVYFTQMESGVLTPNAVKQSGSSLYLSQVVPSAAEMARRYAYRNQQGAIKLDQRDVESTVWGVAPLIKHAFAELLTNALNYSQEEQAITLAQWQSEGLVWMSLLDQGTGLSRQDLITAQKSFDHLDYKQNEQQGLGIGLSVAQRIIEIHGGSFQVGSVPGKGTQVICGLPMFVARG